MVGANAGLIGTFQFGLGEKGQMNNLLSLFIGRDVQGASSYRLGVECAGCSVHHEGQALALSHLSTVQLILQSTRLI